MTALEPALTTEKAAILLLWQRVNTSLSAFYKLIAHFETAQQALQAGRSQWQNLGIHKKHLDRHAQASQEEDAQFIAQLEQRMAAGEFQLLFQQQADYPQQLLGLFDPPPLLFYRGNKQRLNQAQIAIVGSRRPTQKAQRFSFDIAQYLAKSGFIICSGLAQGVDAQAHLGALSQSAEYAGRSVGVMGTGIDVCYPKQHQALFDRMIAEGGCIVSELFPGTPPHKHTFPRRNRIVAGLSLGTVVTEAALQSGSLITARLTSEQGKQVFALPSDIDNVNAQGGHHLIREGATLVYHPDQIVSDLCHQLVTPVQISQAKDTIYGNSSDHFHANATSHPTKHPNAVSSDTTATPKDNVNPILKAQKSVTISEHLQPLWVHIQFEPQDLDALINKTQLDTATLLSQLMELELMGAVAEVGGRYQRV
ncbi:DNA-protecting protein DprA [Psychrobacter sp. YP14]|uniref:DNA-processing protein DprA n=1 Tax=Psychrobacter sp. YP14 TaxID=2203895 RepID=UPI000D7E595C|nr:DNA-processing protein DprA [Psychrobacter sp. YP14]AWT50073.1 DNA-protecting protein DprA [Psychrobacter sp. YP14]